MILPVRPSTVSVTHMFSEVDLFRDLGQGLSLDKARTGVAQKTFIPLFILFVKKYADDRVEDSVTEILKLLVVGTPVLLSFH